MIRIEPTIALVVLSACVDAPHELPPAVLRDTSEAVIVASAVPKWTDEQRWHISAEPALRIEYRDRSPEHWPLDPVSVFRSRRGEIVVADGNQIGWQRVLIYNGDGEFVRHLGRKGKGPCEFGQVRRAWPLRGDSVAVFHTARGVVVMSLDGGCGRSVPMPKRENTRLQNRRPRFENGVVGVYPDGTMLVYPHGYIADTINTGLVWYEHELKRLDRDGQLVRTLGFFPVMQTWWDQDDEHGSLMLQRSAVRALDGFDLLFGDAGSFEILRIDTLGVVRGIMRRPHALQRVTQQDQEYALSRRLVSPGAEVAPSGGGTPTNLDERIADAHWPEFKPVYSDLVVDDGGNVWVEHYRLAHPDLELGSSEPARWSVFNRAGEWLGEVELPGRFFLQSIDDDLVFGIWQDENGTRSVRAYSLRKPT